MQATHAIKNMYKLISFFELTSVKIINSSFFSLISLLSSLLEIVDYRDLIATIAT